METELIIVRILCCCSSYGSSSVSSSSTGFPNEELLISHRREQLWILFLISSAEENSYGSSSSTEERSTYPLQRAGIELPQRPAAVEDPQKRVVIDVPQSRPPQTVLPRTAMDIQKEKEDKEAMRRWRQQGILAGAARFAELEQALQEIRVNALQVLKTPYYRNCKAARNIRRVGMRVMRELCKKMRSETVLIGKERKLGDRGGGGGDGSAPKRRRIGTPSEPKVPATVATAAAADAIVGGSPAGVNFVLVTPDVSTDGPEPMPVKQQQNMLN